MGEHLGGSPPFLEGIKRKWNLSDSLPVPCVFPMNESVSVKNLVSFFFHRRRATIKPRGAANIFRGSSVTDADGDFKEKPAKSLAHN